MIRLNFRSSNHRFKNFLIFTAFNFYRTTKSTHTIMTLQLQQTMPDSHTHHANHTKDNAVVLLSGGLDSITCLYWAKARFYQVTAISFDYGQRHRSELNAAKQIAKTAGVAHRVIQIDLAQLGGSALTDHTLSVPTDGVRLEEIGQQGVPITYVPARNTIFLSYALAVAEVSGANHIVIGVSSVDYSGYPDCRPEYIAAFATMANLATKSASLGQALVVDTPLQYLSKAQTIELGTALGVDYGQTVSCYQADEEGRACGKCESCLLRKQGFLEAGIADPTRYQV